MSKEQRMEEKEALPIASYVMVEAVGRILQKLKTQALKPEEINPVFKELMELWQQNIAPTERAINTTLKQSYAYFKHIGLDIPSLKPLEEQGKFAEYLCCFVNHASMQRFMRDLLDYFARIALLKDKQGLPDLVAMKTALLLFPPIDHKRQNGELACLDGAYQRLDFALSRLILTGEEARAVERVMGFFMTESIRLSKAYLPASYQIHAASLIKEVIGVETKRSLHKIDTLYTGAFPHLPIEAAYDIRSRFLQNFREFLQEEIEEAKKAIAAFNMEIEQLKEKGEKILEDPTMDPKALKADQGTLEIAFREKYKFEYSEVLSRQTEVIDFTLFLNKAYAFLQPGFAAAYARIPSCNYSTLFEEETALRIAEQLKSDSPEAIEEAVTVLLLLSRDFKNRSPLQLLTVLHHLGKPVSSHHSIAAGLSYLEQLTIPFSYLTPLQRDRLETVIEAVKTLLKEEKLSANHPKYSDYVQGKGKIQLIANLISGGAPFKVIEERLRTAKSEERKTLYQQLNDVMGAGKNLALALAFHPDAVALLHALHAQEHYQHLDRFLGELTVIASRYEQLSLLETLVKLDPRLRRYQSKSPHSEGRNAVHWAARNGHISCLRLLLEAFSVEERRKILKLQDMTGLTALHIAAFYEHTAVIYWLHEHGAEMQLKDHKEETALLLAIKEGAVESVRALLMSVKSEVITEEHPFFMEAMRSDKEAILRLFFPKKGDHESLPLSNMIKKIWEWAAERGYVNSLTWCLDAVGLQDKKQLLAMEWRGKAAFYHLARNGDAASLRILLTAIREISDLAPDGRMLLNEAVLSADKETITLVTQHLKERGMPLSALDQTLAAEFIQTLSKNNQFEAAYILLMEGLPFSTFEAAPMWFWAARTGHKPCMEWLYRQEMPGGSKLIASTDIRGYNALLYAAETGKSDIMSYLIAQHAEVNLPNYLGETALHAAACFGHTLCVELLLNAKAEMNCINSNEETPLYKAAVNGHTAIVAKLLEAGAELYKGKAAEKLFSEVLAAGHFDTARLLLKAKIKPEATLSDLKNFWFYAIEKGDTESLRLLSEEAQRALVNLPDRPDGSGLTGLFFACQHRHTDTALYLLTLGANPNLSGPGAKWSPLHMAAKKNLPEIVKALLLKGADMHASDDAKNTALHVAASWGFEKVIRLLIDHGANLKARNNGGMTPLYVAAMYGHSQAIPLLAGKGEMLTQICDKYKRTPLQIAAIMGHAETVTALLATGAKLEEVTLHKTEMTHQGSKRTHKIIQDIEIFRSLAEDIVDEMVKEGGKMLFPGIEIPLSQKAMKNTLPAAVNYLHIHLMTTYKLDVEALYKDWQSYDIKHYAKKLAENMCESKSYREGKVTLKKQPFMAMVRSDFPGQSLGM